MKEIVIKDNGSFGSWDYDTLANEWDGPLEDWGINIPQWDNTDNQVINNSGGGRERSRCASCPFAEGPIHNSTDERS